MIFKGSRSSQFPEPGVTFTVKESLRSTERGSIQVLACEWEVFEDTYHLIACELRARLYRFAFMNTDVNQSLDIQVNI